MTDSQDNRTKNSPSNAVTKRDVQGALSHAQDSQSALKTTVSAAKKPVVADKSADQMLVFGQTEDGAYNVLRKRADELHLGQLRQLEQGTPIHGEVVQLKARPDGGPIYDVDVLLDAPAGRKGPAKVASEPYRRGWDAIFGHAEEPSTKPELN